jgi:hypothetical protein
MPPLRFQGGKIFKKKIFDQNYLTLVANCHLVFVKNLSSSGFPYKPAKIANGK